MPAKPLWSAYYYDGQSAKRRDATVELTPDSLIITVRGEKGRERVVWDYKGVIQTQGFNDGEPVRIERGEEALIITGEGGGGSVAQGSDLTKSFAASLASFAPAYASRFSPPESGRRNVFFVLLLSVLMVIGGLSAYFYLIPRAAVMAAESLPASFEEKLGESFVAEIKTLLPECSSEAVTAPVLSIVKTLSASTPDNPYEFKVHILKDKSINAFAAPGGHIVVLTGLIEASETPEELAGVLAHEMQHILKKHATKRMFEDMTAGVLLSFIFGDAKGVSGALKAAGGLRYSRTLEEEADKAGAELLVRAGVDPDGMIRFFEGLKKDAHGIEEASFLRYISTHPLTNERIEYIKGHIKEMPLQSTALLPDVDWEGVRKACQ